MTLQALRLEQEDRDRLEALRLEQEDRDRLEARDLRLAMQLSEAEAAAAVAPGPGPGHSPGGARRDRTADDLDYIRALEESMAASAGPRAGGGGR